MSVEFLPVEGGCRCDRVRFVIDRAPLITTACHCRGCQRMTGGPYSLSAMVSAAAFAVTKGDPVIGGLHGSDIHHYFCPYCMSWVFTRIDGFGDFVNVRSSLLDDPRPFPPFVETCTSEKLPWTTTPAVHSFEHYPPPEDYERLLRSYAAQRAAAI